MIGLSIALAVETAGMLLLALILRHNARHAISGRALIVPAELDERFQAFRAACIERVRCGDVTGDTSKLTASATAGPSGTRSPAKFCTPLLRI